jgi:hypothetical protein
LLPNARLELISQFKPQELLPSSLLDKFSEPAVAGQQWHPHPADCENASPGNRCKSGVKMLIIPANSSRRDGAKIAQQFTAVGPWRISW